MGPDETRFDLHRGVLCASSDFFKAVITSSFREREQNEIKLPEQDVKIFKFFVHWLYTRSLRGFYYPDATKPSLQELRQAAIAEVEAQGLDALEDLDRDNPSGRVLYMAHYRDAPFSHLIGLYILADTLLVHGLKDPVITSIIDVYCWSEPTQVAGDGAGAKGIQRKGKEADEVKALHTGPGIDSAGAYTSLFWSPELQPELDHPCKGINRPWAALPRTSPRCRLIVECFCDNVMLVEEHTNGRPYHPGFLAAVAQNYAVRLGRVDVTFQAPDWDQKGQICRFHEHSAGSECLFAKREVFARNSHRSD